MNTFFTFDEKRVIVYILSEIMKADEIIHPKELEYMNSVLSELDFSGKDFDHLEMIDMPKAKMMFADFSEPQKDKAKQYFMKMAFIDGDYDVREEALINSL